MYVSQWLKLNKNRKIFDIVFLKNKETITVCLLAYMC